MSFTPEEEYNEVVVTLSFAPDKWMGLDSWREDVAALLLLVDRLGMNEGRRTAEVEKRTVGTDDGPGWGFGNE